MPSGYSRDFQTAKLLDDQVTIEVFAHSIDLETQEAGSKDPAAAIYVGIVRSPGVGDAFVSDPVTSIGSGWTATIRKTDKPGWPSVTDEVYVIGVATLGDEAPEIWQETLSLTSRTGSGDDGEDE